MEPARRVARTISSLFALLLVLATVYAAGALLSPIPPLTPVEREFDTRVIAAQVKSLYDELINERQGLTRAAG